MDKNIQKLIAQIRKELKENAKRLRETFSGYDIYTDYPIELIEKTGPDASWASYSINGKYYDRVNVEWITPKRSLFQSSFLKGRK